MKHRTLWSAVDADRSRWWMYGAYLVLCLSLLGAGMWLWAASGFSGRGTRGLGNALALIVPLALFPIMRKRAAREAIRSFGAIRVPPGVLSETRKALADFSISRGESVPDLWMFRSDSINAVAYREKKKDRIAVSTEFGRLPVDEQRAGIAMLLARGMLSLDSIVVSSKHGIPSDRDGNPYTPADLADPGIRERVASSWLEAAAAGDRQALMLVRDPRPMLVLLKRLASATTYLPLESLDAGYGCLAWPFGHKGAQGVMDDLPPKARAALAALIVQGGRSGGCPETARLARIQAVLPAAEREVPEPEPLSDNPVSATGLTSGSVAPARPAPVAAARSAASRIARSCPKCGANNVATNRACIACGKALPASAR